MEIAKLFELHANPIKKIRFSVTKINSHEISKIIASAKVNIRDIWQSSYPRKQSLEKIILKEIDQRESQSCLCISLII